MNLEKPPEPLRMSSLSTSLSTESKSKAKEPLASVEQDQDTTRTLQGKIVDAGTWAIGGASAVKTAQIVASNYLVPSAMSCFGTASTYGLQYAPLKKYGIAAILQSFASSSTLCAHGAAAFVVLYAAKEMRSYLRSQKIRSRL